LSGLRGVELLTKETLGNLEATHTGILRSVDDAYRRIISENASFVLLGADTLQEGVQKSLDQFAAEGITGFVDKRGRGWSMEAYTEMAMRSDTGRAAVQGHIDRLLANGYNLVIVSDAPRECPLCRPWEGKVLQVGPQHLHEESEQPSPPASPSEAPQADVPDVLTKAPDDLTWDDINLIGRPGSEWSPDPEWNALAVQRIKEEFGEDVAATPMSFINELEKRVAASGGAPVRFSSSASSLRRIISERKLFEQPAQVASVEKVVENVAKKPVFKSRLEELWGLDIDHPLVNEGLVEAGPLRYIEMAWSGERGDWKETCSGMRACARELIDTGHSDSRWLSYTETMLEAINVSPPTQSTLYRVMRLDDDQIAKFLSGVQNLDLQAFSPRRSFCETFEKLYLTELPGKTVIIELEPGAKGLVLADVETVVSGSIRVTGMLERDGVITLFAKAVK